MAIPTSRESDKFVLRLPEGMRDRIKAAADAANRSMNAEIISRLTDSLNGTVGGAQLSIAFDFESIGKPELIEKFALLEEHLRLLNREFGPFRVKKPPLPDEE